MKKKDYERHLNHVRWSGICTAMTMLTEADVDKETTVTLMQKYYGLSEQETSTSYEIEKKVLHPCRELKRYLISEKRFSNDAAISFIRQHRISEMLWESPKLNELSPEELLFKLHMNVKRSDNDTLTS